MAGYLGTKREMESDSRIHFMVTGYLDCAIRTMDDDYREIRKTANTSTFREADWNKAWSECSVFLDKALELGFDFEMCNLSHLGHDFWLSRNREGSGFFDKPERYGGKLNKIYLDSEEQLWDKLQKAANDFGECRVEPFEGSLELVDG